MYQINNEINNSSELDLIRFEFDDQRGISMFSKQEFIERRRAALERFLNRTAAHSVLRMDPDFRDFLETDELPRATETMTFR